MTKTIGHSASCIRSRVITRASRILLLNIQSQFAKVRSSGSSELPARRDESNCRLAARDRCPMLATYFRPLDRLVRWCSAPIRLSKVGPVWLATLGLELPIVCMQTITAAKSSPGLVRPCEICARLRVLTSLLPASLRSFAWLPADTS